MRESVLKDFLEGSVAGDVLAADLDDALRYSGGRTFLNAEAMDTAFPIHASHLIKVCDAFLESELSPENIEAIGFCLIASDAFDFDTNDPEGELISETCNDWAAPEINYPITNDNMMKFRHRLATGENAFTSDDISASA